MSQLEVRVAVRRQEAQDIDSFELVSLDGQQLPPFTAGAHIDVSVPNGMTRQYSLCNNPQESHRYLIGVLKVEDSRGGSHAMHAAVPQGGLLRIGEPKNHFALAPDATHSVLLAGGIGVTPLMAMAEHLSAQGQSFEMHYCTRSPERTAFRQRLLDSSFASCVQFHFDSESAAQKLDMAGLLATPQEGHHIYVCGPKGFMDAVLATARSAKWPEKNIHYEFFSADVADDADATEFQVQIASSGKIVTVAKDQTVVQALAAAGVVVETSCEQGVCGTCLTGVLEGVPKHNDVYLMPDEQARNDQFLPCCSRSKTPLLVLDL